MNLYAQTTYFSRSPGGNWNAAASWSTVAFDNPTNTGTFPVAGDIVFIGGSGSFITTATASVACASLDIDDNSTLNVSNSLVVSGPTTVGSGSSGVLAITSTNGIKQFSGLVTINSGGLWNEAANETIIFRGGIINNGTFIASSGVHTFDINSQSLTGTFSIPNVTVTGAAVVLTNNNSLTVTALSGTGGITQGSGATLNIGATSGITTMIATASGNTVNYTRNTGVSQIVKNVNYDNLGLSGNGVKTLSVGTTSITGDLSLSGAISTTAVVGLTIGGDVNIGSGTTLNAGAFTHNVAGDWTNNGTFTGAGGSIIFNGAAQNITGGTTTFNDVTLSGSGTKTLGVSPLLTIAGTLSIDNGVVANLSNANTHTSDELILGGAFQLAGTWGSTVSGATNPNDTFFTGNGLVTVATGGPITYYSRSPGGNWNSPASWSTVAFDNPTNTGTFPAADDIVFIGGVGSVVTITGAIASCASLDIADNSILNIANGLSVFGPTTVGSGSSGVLAITNLANNKQFFGPVTINNGGLWNETVNEAIIFQGGITNNGSIIAGTGVHTFNTNSQALTGTFSIPNVTVTGAAVVLTNNNTLTVNTALSGTGGITQAAGATLNIGGTSAITNLTVAASGNTVNYTGAAQTVRNVAYDNLGLSGSGVKTLPVGMTAITGNLDLSGTASTTAVVDLTIGGDVTIGVGATFTAGAFTHNVGGDWTNNGTFTGTGSKINLNGGTQSIGGGTTTFDDLQLSGSGTKTLNVSTTISDELSISNGAIADLNNANVYTSNTLILTNALQGSGTWGSTSSSPAAANQNNTFFSGNGLITVATGGFTYYSIASTDWNLPSTWSTTGFGGSVASSTPGVGNFVIIGDGHTVTVTGNEVCEVLSFDAGTSVTNTLLITSGSLTVAAGITIPQTVTSGSNILSVGAGSLSAASIDFTSTPGGAGHQLLINTGTVTISGDITGIGTSSTVQFTGAGLLQLGGIFYTATNGTLTMVAGSTFEYNGSSAQTVQAHVYQNLTLSGGNTKTLSINATISGNLTIGDNTTFAIGGVVLVVSGTTTVGGGTSGTLSITSATGNKTFTGLVTINSGATWTNTTEAVTFQGGITNNGTFTSGTGVYTFLTNSQALTGTFSIPNVTVTGAAVVLTNNNTLTVNTALSGTGRITQAAGATLNIGGTSTITNMTATASGNTVNYTGAAQIVKNVAYENLVLSGSGVKPLQVGTTSITGDLILSGTVSVTGVIGLTIGGDVNIGSGSTFTSGAFTHIVRGDWINNGNFNASTGTLSFSGTATQSIQGTSVTTFNNININNTAAFVNVESSQNLRGILTLAPLSNFDADGTLSTSVFTLLSTSSIPVVDGAIAAIPADATFIGNVTVQRFMENAGKVNRYISAPVASMPASQLDFTKTNNSIRYYNETVPGAIGLGYTFLPLVSSFQIGLGYLAYMYNAVDLTWDATGAINQGSIPLPVSFTASSGGPDVDGWNLVGNPYPSGIIWASGAGWTTTNIDPIISVPDLSIVSGYPNYYHTWNSDDNSGDLPNGFIAMGQAFWVHANAASPVLTVNESAKSPATGGDFYRKASSSKSEQLIVAINNGKYEDRSFLKLNDKATEDYDSKFDGYKLKNEEMNIYLIDNAQRSLVMHTLSEIPGDMRIPLGVEVTTPGEYEITFANVDLFSASPDLFLIDSFEGQTIPVTAGKGYTFKIQDVTKPVKDRFYLSRNTVIAEKKMSDWLQAFPNPVKDELTIVIPSNETAKVTLFDSTGAMIWADEIKGTAKADLRNYPSGMFLLKVLHGNEVVVRKIMK